MLTMQNLIDINGDGRPDLVYGGGAAINTPVPGGRTSFSPVPHSVPFHEGLSITYFQELASLGAPRQVYHPIGADPNLPDGSQPIPKRAVLKKTIDMNGDGRLDIIDTYEEAVSGMWSVYLNTPHPADPNAIVWLIRKIPTAPIRQHLLEAGYHPNLINGDLPLEMFAHTHDSLYNLCWKWAKDSTGTLRWSLSLEGYSGPDNNKCTPPQGQMTGRSDFAAIDLAAKTITEWELRDINGDGYPDFVYNASPVGGLHPNDVDNPLPSQAGSFAGQFTQTQKRVTRDILGESRDVKALLNVAGVHLDEFPLAAEFSAFSAPITLEVGGPNGCGVGRWTDDILHNSGGVTVTSPGTSVQVCGFADVNGDGLADRVTFDVWSGPPVLRGKAALGTGDVNAPFSASATMLLPGPIARAETDLRALDDLGHFKPRVCPDGFPDPPTVPNPLGIPRETYPIQKTAGLRDINGDGIPDYIFGDNNTGGTTWTVAIGTGTGFAPAKPVVSPVGLELSLELVGCYAEFAFGDFNVGAGTPRGLYDIDGDGRPEVLVLNNGSLDVYQLNAQPDPQHPFDGNVPSSPTEGRLVTVDNGYGAITRIGYRSAKEDTSTAHLVPFPEVVVTSVETIDTAGSPLLAPTQYAYGGARLIFDPAVDAFRFPGYQRSLAFRLTSNQVIPPPTDGVVTITDHYGLAPFAPTMDANARFKRYLQTGRVRDVTVLSGPIGTDPWALLSTNIDNDARRIAGVRYEWDTRLLPAGASESEVCLDMVFPYDYRESRANSLGLDPCTQRGFVFQQAVVAWRGTPGTGSALTTGATVQTASVVRSIDDFGRITSVKQYNDLVRNDDDLCIDTVYATPTGTKERVLSAPASRSITNCTGVPEVKVTYTTDTWEYDTSPAGVKLPPGLVAHGFVTAHTVSRRNLDTGAALGDIRVFDATYDPATGRLRTVTRTRDDGARQMHTWAYDPFGLVPVSVRTDATNANGTTLPFLHTSITRDPITLQALTTTDPNGTQTGNTFDGFNRVLLSTVAPPGGTAGALAAWSYLGFAVGQPGGRRIVQTVFPDPVAPASVDTTAGRTGTVFLDQLGRERRTEVALGADYAHQTLVLNERSYDRLGRVRFEADPYLSTEGALYGTNYHFNIDGTPSCFIRGRGLLGFSKVTDEVSERYPTCFSRSFNNNEESVQVRDAASLLAGSPQAGVVQETSYSAIGRVLSRATYKPTPDLVPLERATFGYDALGHLTSMARYPDPLSTATVTTAWHYDSLGQVLALEEPDSAPQFRSYDTWGALTQVQWLDTTTTPATDRRIITQYDALGRVMHREDRTNNVVEAATVNDYLYDQPVNVTMPPVVATHVRGRLAKATFPTGAVAFSYDGLGRVNAQTFTDTTTTPVGVYVEKRAYHGDGALAALELLLPDTDFRTEHVAYRYDSAGRIRSVDYADGTVDHNLFSAAGSADIDPLGRLRQAQFGLATYTASYADTGRRLLNSVKVTSPSLNASREIAYLALPGAVTAYDPLGRERSRREVTNGTAAPALVSTYDELGRLAASARLDDNTGGLGVQRTFTYDPLGNLLKQADLSSPTAPGAVQLRYQSTDRDRICSIGYGTAAPSPSCTVTYDGVGNILSYPTRSNGTRTLRYFANGQVQEITDGKGNHALFRYDAFGAVQQLVLTGNTPDTRHDHHFGALITKRDEVVAGTRTSVLTRAIPGPGVIATRHGATATPTATWTFAFGEGRGNRFFTDQHGAFVQDVAYQPYGEATSTGAQPGAPTYSSAQWNGGDHLAALGLVQLGARLYDPVLGRFLSRDPLLIPRTAATTNPYAFAMNDPVNSADPGGLDNLGDEGDSLADDYNYCPDCWGHEVIRIDGGHWDPETENHPAAGDGATGVGAFTYPEPSANPVVPTTIRFTTYGKLVYWLDVAHAMDRGDWDNPLVKIWTVDWSKEDFEAVENYQKWQARIEMAQAIVTLPIAVGELAEFAGGIGIASALRALRGSQIVACVGGPGPCVPNAVNSIRSTLGLDRVAMRQAAVTTDYSAQVAAVAARTDALNLAKSEGGLRLSSGLTRLARDGGRLVDADYFVIKNTQSGQHALHLTVRNGAGIIVDGAVGLPLRVDSFPSGTLYYRVLGAE
jgi:RHS repeat-associated protein